MLLLAWRGLVRISYCVCCWVYNFVCILKASHAAKTPVDAVLVGLIGVVSGPVRGTSKDKVVECGLEAFNVWCR